jgi:hypothetical protein
VTLDWWYLEGLKSQPYQYDKHTILTSWYALGDTIHLQIER